MSPRSPLSRFLDEPFLQTLYSGVDARGRIDSASRLNSYGSAQTPGTALLLGSCTSSPPSPRGFAAAEVLHDRWRGASHQWFSCAEATRDKLRQLWGLPAAVDIALCPSGTDAEYIPLCLAKAHVPNREVCTIIAEPKQLGRGSIPAAQGLPFDAGAPLEASECPPEIVPAIRSRVLALEDSSPEEIITRLRAIVGEAIGLGQLVVGHHIAHGKLGVCGPKWEMLVALKDQFADRVMLVVDAAQGRFRRHELRQWLADDAVVIVTGSKFYGAPSFCGAVLIPPRWRPVGSFLSAALSGYCSQADFPPHYEAAALEHQGNPGLLLRWACALAEMEAFYAIAAERRSAVTQCFHEEATLALTQSSSTRVVVRGEQPAGWPARTVVSFEVLDRGRPMSDAVLHRIRASLAKDEPGVLLGQPSAGTLRVALGAPLVVDLSQRADSAELLRAWFSSLTQRIEEFVERERV